MITFVSYKPGARGKFLSEICDLSKTNLNKLDDSLYRHSHGSNGQVQWTMALIPFFEKTGLGFHHIHGIFPEKENYKTYIDLIVQGLQEFEAADFTVDIHYIEQETLQYILDAGHRVVRIVVATQVESEELQNNFFYKNFIAPSSIKTEQSEAQKLALAVKLAEDDYHNPDSWVPKHLVELALAKRDQKLENWGRDALNVLYKCSGSLARRLQKKNIITHENLFEIQLSNILNLDEVAKVINFVGGEVNEDVVKRFEAYKEEQRKIPPFKDYINSIPTC